MVMTAAVALDSSSNDRIAIQSSYKHVGGFYTGDGSTGHWAGGFALLRLGRCGQLSSSTTSPQR
eukprot:8797172-Pyramimonas_sp.AAC.1